MKRFLTCLKWIVFIFNLLFWLCGLTILGLAIFLRVHPSTTPFFDDNASINRYHVATYILMAVGILMAVIGFLGCCGALRSSRCMLGTFFSLLIVVFIAEVAGGIVAYLHKDQLSKTFMENGFFDVVKSEYKQPGFDARTQYFDLVQTELECCGARTYKDWFQSDWRGGNGDLGSNGTQEYIVPFSCCKKEYRHDDRCLPTNDKIGIVQNFIVPDTLLLNEKGCGEKLKDTIVAHQEIVIGVGVGLAILQVFGLIFSIILCCTIKPERYGYKS